MIKIVSGKIGNKEIKTEEVEGTEENLLKMISNLQNTKLLLPNAYGTSYYHEDMEGNYKIMSIEG
ncbi:hypothetical protein [Methanococcus maripaludis]|jgi:hypothetical protein|uniref:Uncharacterized protein n=1 Tax=Methanococcus maripaludis TaxID=39152 RepID=A0A7J9PMZ1_METMI|nr:hypothetical protein [Methanococcus maripaludis]MBA2863977.1 hypothetical protein [Methanococcus maripaludis]